MDAKVTGKLIEGRRRTATVWLPVEFLSTVTVLSDLLALAIATIFSFMLCAGAPPAIPEHYMAVICVFGLLQLVFEHFSGLFQINSILAPLRSLRQILFCSLSSLLLVGALAYSQGFYTAFVPEWVAWFLGLHLFATVAGRSVVFTGAYSLSERGIVGRRAAIVGVSHQAVELIRRLQTERPRITQIVGVFDDRNRPHDLDIDPAMLNGGLDALIAQIRQGKIDDVIISLPWSADQRIKAFVDRLGDLPVRIHVGTDLIGFVYPSRVSNEFHRSLTTIEVMKKPLDGWRAILKAFEDRILAGIILLLFSPIMLLVALLIRLGSPGPVLFRQPRYGFNNQKFQCFKFRTMYVNHESRRTEQATKDDPRITLVGRFLRRTSLDELPQLFNVLIGDMSLVGPRPHAVDHNEYYGEVIDRYYARHKVKPGITGWAQVNGFRGETDTLDKMEFRVRYDLYYIENWSIQFDLEVLMLTLFVGFIGKNAY